MILTRLIDVTDRVFTVPDLLRFAAVLDGRARDAEGEASTSYEVMFEEPLSVEGTAVEVFNEEVLTRPSPPLSIEMRLMIRATERFARIDFCPYELPNRNRIRVTGQGEEWVNGLCSDLQRALEKCAPQLFWWRSHQTLLAFVIALAIANGQIVAGFLLASAFFWVPAPGSLIAAVHHLSFGGSAAVVFIGRHLSLVALPFVWLLNLPSGYYFRRKILEMWPRVEFDFGSPHLRPAHRREKLNAILFMAVIPLVVSALFEAFKAAYH